MRQACIAALGCLTFVACKKQPDKQPQPVLTLELPAGDDVLPVGDVIDVEGWVCLEAEGSDFVGTPQKLEVFGGDYYLLDHTAQRCVLVYDAQGRQKGKIGKLGPGPEEYPSIMDFAVNRRDSTVLIMSGQSQVYQYRLDGSFVNSFSSDSVPFGNVASAKGDVWLSSNYSSPREAYLLYRYNGLLEPDGEWVRYDGGHASMFSMFTQHLQVAGDELYYVDNVNLKVLRYDAATDSVSECYAFTLPHPMPVESFADNTMLMSRMQEYDWLMCVDILPANMFVVYVAGGKQCVAVFGHDGRLLKSGEYRGAFPQCYAGTDGSIVSPVTIDEYFWQWEKADVPQPAVAPTENTNLLLLKWRLKR